VNVRAFRLTYENLRELESLLHQAGLSRRDSLKAIATLRKWLPRDAAAPEDTPSDLAVPDGSNPHPEEGTVNEHQTSVAVRVLRSRDAY
jgi:hypothetical protein